MKLIRKPKSFQIGARTIKFSRGPRVDAHLEDKGYVGEFCYSDNNISVKQVIPNIDEEHVTNLHEVVHCILSHMRWDELNQNEDFVDQFAENLYQALKTLK